ncbi:MAG TPA: zinc-finger domain-containing protein [Gammaproteobacteria bacterium]|nr:zinc-finger domain-containing protein [Gammaproteobacteria bacterium]
MSNQQKKQPNATRKVLVAVKDLPIHCPLPDSTLWNSHPRVYIPLEKAANRRALCPYCGTEFILE